MKRALRGRLEAPTRLLDSRNVNLICNKRYDKSSSFGALVVRVVKSSSGYGLKFQDSNSLLFPSPDSGYHRLTSNTPTTGCYSPEGQSRWGYYEHGGRRKRPDSRQSHLCHTGRR